MKLTHFLIPTTLTLLALQTGSALAAGSGMPWEAPLTQILESVEGPVARIVAVLVIIVTGLSLAFGDTSGGFRRIFKLSSAFPLPFPRLHFFSPSSPLAAAL